MRTIATLTAGAALTMVTVMGPSASAGLTHSAKCASVPVRPVHQMAPTGMVWQLVRPDTAKALHISPCSIILDGPLVNGNRSAMIITPHLRIFRS